MASRAHTQQGEDRRAELLAHAERLFLERGVAETRMVDIANAAGVAKGLAYWYFDGKESILLAIAADVHERLRATQRAAVADVERPLEQLYVGVVTAVRFVDEHWNLFVMIVWALADKNPGSASDASRLHADDSVEVIIAGQADGTIRDDEDPVLLAQSHQAIVNHMVLTRQNGLIADVDTAAHAAARAIVHLSATTPELAREVIAAHRVAT
jgi:TetR/AcrR family transcriptional regulator, cholesterol catabolism regulator